MVDKTLLKHNERKCLTAFLSLRLRTFIAQIIQFGAPVYGHLAGTTSSINFITTRSRARDFQLRDRESKRNWRLLGIRIVKML